LEENNLSEDLGYESKKDWWQWLVDPFYVEHRKMPGWSGFLPFYHFKCDKHGDQISYPHGHKEKLRCPQCLAEKKETV